jgi:hypothetical protein
MKKEKVIKLLIDNGYILHPVFNFYYQDKIFSSYFYVNDNSICIGKIKWSSINLKEYKVISLKSFIPSRYSLK